MLQVLQHRIFPREPKARHRPSVRFVLLSLSTLVTAILQTGCVDGPLFALKRMNPYFRAQWKEDAEKGIVFRERQKEIRLVRKQIGEMPEEEQTKWIAELAKVADYETSAELRRDAVMALGASTHPSAEAALTRACSDSSEKVRIAACHAMANRQSESLAKMLSTVARSDKSISVRSAAIHSLGTYQSDEAKSILRNALEEKSPAIQHEALVALQTMTGRDFQGSVEQMKQFLDGKPVEEPVPTIAEKIGSAFQFK